jgi:hypothetical protein
VDLLDTFFSSYSSIKVKDNADVAKDLSSKMLNKIKLIKETTSSTKLSKSALGKLIISVKRKETKVHSKFKISLINMYL